MIDLSDLDSWKPQKAGAVDLSDLDSWKPPESERDRIQKAKAEAIWGGSFDEWKARKEQADAEQARMVAESEAGNVGSRRAQEFQRKTEALNREGMITGDFSPDSLRAERALESGRLSAQAALGGALRLAGETADQAAEFSGLGYGSEMAGKALGILNAGADPASTRFALASMKSDPRKPNALAHAGSEIYDAAITEQADLSPLMIERPESLMSGQGLKYIAQGALQSAPVTATGLAAAMLNPEIGLLMIGGSAAGAKFGESRAEDRDYWLSAEAAAVAAATETVPEVLPILALSGKLLKYMPKGLGAKLAKIPGGRAVATSLAEGGSEVVTELGNIAYEIAREGKEYSADEVANRLVDSFAIGTAIGGAMGGAASAAGVGGDAYNQNVIDVLERDNMRRAAMDRRTPATNGQPLTAPINFTTEAAKLTNKLLGDAPPTVSAGADLAEQAIADAGLNRPSQSPQLTTAAEVDSLLAGVESQAPSFVGGENGLAATGGIEGSLGGIEIGGRGNGAVEGIASTGAQVSDVNGERGSAGDIATPPGVTTLPDGTTFVPGNPAELRQRLADAGIPTRGVIRTIDGVEGVRFGRDTAQTVLGVLGGSQQGATTGAQALGVPDSNAASGVTGAQSRNEQLGLQAGSGVSAQRAADQGQSNPVADGMAGIAQDQSGVSAAQSTEPTQAQGAAEPSARFPNGVPESLRGLTDPELDQFAGLEAEIHAATSAQGGKAIMNDKGEAIGRQRWAIMEPDSGFWRQRTQKITAKEGIAALRKAQSGEKLTRKEANFVNYAKEWAKTYADNLIANEVASQTEYKASQRESATAEIESTMASVADTSPQQRASVQSLGSDYTEQLIALKRARKAGQLNPDQQEQYIDLLEQDRETGKVAGRPMVGIGNKTAYVDALMEGRLLPVQVFVDADNFKSLNDKFGHDVGDDVIRLLADEMVAEFGEGNVFHRGGDEFLTQGNTQEEADAKMARVQERMMGLRLELPLSDGRTAILPGVGVSYGTGSNEKVADDSLKQDKERRKAAGLRTDRRSGDDAGSVGAQPASSGAQASRTNQGDSAAAGAGQVNGVQPNARTQAPVRGADSVAPARAKSVDAVQGFDVEGARAELTETLGPKFLRRLESQPWFHLVDSLDQIPEKVRKSLTDAESAAGFVHSDGDVYIIAGNIDSNVTGVVLHEVGVHFGMPKILGNDFASTLARFKSLKAKGGLVGDAYARAEKVSDRGKSGELTPAALAVLDEEALAYYVEANWNQDVPLMARIVNAVKSFLNRMGVPLSRLNASPELLVQVARGAADRASRGLVTVKGGKVKYHKAWHGSPHDFDQFRLDDSTLGTGEGAQAYGVGLYFSGAREVADYYREVLRPEIEITDWSIGSMRLMRNGDYLDYSPRGNTKMDEARAVISESLLIRERDIKDALDKGGIDAAKIVANEVFDETLELRPDLKHNIAALRGGVENMVLKAKIDKGRLYEVELAPKESDYLDWDRPLSEQSESVKRALESAGIVNFAENIGPSAAGVTRNLGWSKNVGSLRGEELYRRLVEQEFTPDKGASTFARKSSEADVSRILHAAGIPGIRYLDGSSRGKGEGSSNYVIFDDKSVSVVNKYSRKPDTIKVDGKDRPTTDSTGKRIHPTDEGVRNFWRWFGDSKVVDGQGRPLVVYHGTNDLDMRVESGVVLFEPTFGTFDTEGGIEPGAWFSPDERFARKYSKIGVTTMHYLRATSPMRNESPISVPPADADAVYRVRGNGDGIQEAKEIAVFRPEQIKSATGNSGAFSPTDSRIAYSRKVPRTAAQEAALAKAGMPEDNRTLAKRGKDYIASQWGKVRDLASLATVDSVFDRFHRMSSIEQELGVPPERSAYISARLAAGLPSIMEGVMMYGAPKWDGGVLTVDESTVGLLDALAPVKDDINGWLGWMVGRRAKVLKAQGRENLMDDADIAALLSLSKGREQEFQDAALKYLRIKKAILDVAEQAGLIDPAVRATWDSVEYIPFYRQDETEGDTIGPGTRKGLEGQSSGIRQLKGGQQNLADPLGNIVRNFTKLIDASLKNNSMLEAVDGYGPAFFERVPMSGTMERIPLSQIKKVLIERGVPQTIIDAMPQGTLSGLTKMWSVKPPSDEDVVRVMRGGKAEYYRVPDKDLLLALTSFKVKSTGLVVSPFKFFKKLLTAGVTSSPEFMARNFVRDSLSSWVISDDKFAVGWDSAKGVISPLLDKTTQKEMMFAGGSFIGGHFYDVGSDAETAKSLRRALRGGTVKQSASAILGFLKGKGLSAADAKAMADTIVTSPVALWDKWQKVGSYLENANRNAIFENAIKAGRSRKEAAYLARDLMDFSMHGNSAFIQIASDVLPFFNARLQGLYKLYRQGGKKALRKALLMRAGITVGMTLGLLAWNLMMYADGYDELEDWDKDTYWHIMPGTKWHIRIPKPFELGVLFATVPERVARAVTYQIPGGDAGDTPKQTMNSFLAQVGGTLAMNPIPQGVMPIVEQWANKTFFTGRPIENMGDEKLLPEARAEWYTSDTAKAISGMIGNKTGLSPKRIEHLWNGYTGTMGAYALDTVDWLVRSVEGTPDRPELAWSEMPLAKAFYRGDSPPKNTRYTTEFYDLAEKADQVSGTIKDYLVSGETEKALKLEAENAALLGKRVKSKTAKAGIMFENVKTYAKIKRELSDIRKQIEGVIVMPGISPEAKRARIEQLTMRRNKLTRDAIAASRRTGR